MKLAPEHIVQGIHDLPSLPAVVIDLLGNLEHEDIDISVLAKKVAHDPALTAKTLRLANCAAFGLQVKVTTIQQAITFLGFHVLAWRKQHDCSLLDAERAVLGVDHIDAGVALADHWHFSETMRQAIARHHAPDTPGSGVLAAIVHVADAIVHALDIAGDADEQVPAVSALAWDAMGLTEEAYLHLFRETELQFEEMSAILVA